MRNSSQRDGSQILAKVRFINKIGQASLEYTTIYIFVLVVIAIGAITVWQMGAFTPIQNKHSTFGLVGFSQVTPLDFALYHDTENLSLKLKNNAGDSISVDQISLDIGDISCSSNPAISITSGGAIYVQIHCSGISKYSKGNYFSANITIFYTNLRTGNSGHVSMGKIWGNVE